MAEKVGKKKSEECRSCSCWKGQGASGGIYGLGFIGALFYYIPQAATFWAGVLGFLKALVWPAFLVYRLLSFLKA
ncbi:MAG: hypothetical protein V1820_02955 [archaeon]